MPLIKHIPEPFVNSFLSDGTIRIGSIHNYQSQHEAAGNGINDPQDGIHLGEHALSFTSPINKYVYCLSSTEQPFDLEACKANYKSGSFFVILDIYSLLDSIRDKLSEIISPTSIHIRHQMVEYYNPIVGSLPDIANPAFYKTITHNWQNEYRILVTIDSFDVTFDAIYLRVPPNLFEYWPN